jgi:hypothetical protein
MTSHSDARQWIEQAADGVLPSSQQQALQEHLKSCAECRGYAAELANLETSLAAAMSAHWPQSGLSKEAQSDLIEKLTGSPPGGTLNFPLIGGGLLLTLLLLAAYFGFTQGGADIEQPTTTATQVSSPSSSTTSTPLVAAIATETPEVLTLTAIPLQNANCREGNGSIFEIADTLFEGEEYTPIGRGFDNLWVQFLGPRFEEECWVFIENITLLINNVPTPIGEVPEFLLPFVSYPPTPTMTPTLTFTPEPAETEQTSTPTTAPPTAPQCSDGVDNDKDGSIDYGRDPQCASQTDNDESK